MTDEEKLANENLRAEYLLIQGQYEDFDKRALSLKALATPLLGAGLTVGVKEASLLVLVATILVALTLWVLEALWKSFQYSLNAHPVAGGMVPRRCFRRRHQAVPDIRLLDSELVHHLFQGRPSDAHRFAAIRRVTLCCRCRTGAGRYSRIAGIGERRCRYCCGRWSSSRS